MSFFCDMLIFFLGLIEKDRTESLTDILSKDFPFYVFFKSSFTFTVSFFRTIRNECLYL